MTQLAHSLSTTAPSTRRRIGPFGTTARVLGGIALLTAAFLNGVSPLDLLVGLVATNALVVAALAARGTSAPPLRLTGPIAHTVNIGLVIAFLNLLPVPAMLFYGTASLLAAARSYGACEMFAVSNWLRRRDDQFACPFYLPADLLDQHLTQHTPNC